MSAVLKPSADRQSRFRKPAVGSSTAQVAAFNQNGRQRSGMSIVPQSTAVRRLPAPEAAPNWLRSLIKLQQVSLVATFTLSGLTLVTYGWTVYAQQLWGKEYHKLEELRRNERQLGANSAMLQNHLANQANSPGATLVPRTSASMIFLKPAPVRGATPTAPTPQASPIAPLGY